MGVRRYIAELGAALVLYAVLLVGSLTQLRHGDVPPDWRIAIGLLPMIGGVAAAWAVLRQFGRMDELQRKFQFDAISLAFLGTALISFSYGFLENAGFPRLSMFAVWPVMGGLWAIGSIASVWRYRR